MHVFVYSLFMRDNKNQQAQRNFCGVFMAKKELKWDEILIDAE